MPNPDLERIRGIKTFPSLVKYLRDDLDWPIESDDFDDLTFDFEPQELGIDPKTSAKIELIKQLRPLSSSQPWGIFFIKFEPKKLPVVALRRILGQLVIKKRASANRADQQTWRLSDLLFLSNYGENEQRQITFAHFSCKDDSKNLPTLKVLGWDDSDTALHIDYVHTTLENKLRWPDDENNIDAWRSAWSSAFTLKHREVIDTSKKLAIKLASLAQKIRKRANLILTIETDSGPLCMLMKGFKEALIHDLTEDSFADMYAQTIAYGLLTARITNPKGDNPNELSKQMPITNPFLKELMESFLSVGGRKGESGKGVGIDFDELGINEVVDLLDNSNMEAVVRDFGDNNPLEDPVIHFYELFLREYDSEVRMQRGVFYTARPVVSFIVRSVDEVLRSEFGLKDGLADTTTWGEMVERLEGLKIPKDAKSGDSFVQILDPATGTGTFLVEVIDVINTTMVKKWKAEGLSGEGIVELWNDYVPTHLLPRLHGYELLMAPYAIAHMKIGLKLYETGYNFESDERARIYLTNALEPAHDFSDRLSFIIPSLAHEAKAVNKIKLDRIFTIVIGNPPYSVTSLNFNPFIDDLMNDYKKHVQGETGLVALSDDYLKFIRLAQHLLHRSFFGVWGMITNHGYLKGIIHRGVRKELVNEYGSIFILDLHGDSNIGERPPAGQDNKNVFDIKQGVAVTLGLKKTKGSLAETTVCYDESWGTRKEKYDDLIGHPILSGDWKALNPYNPNFFFIPFDDTYEAEFRAMPSIKNYMPVNSCGVKTHRDGLVIDFDKEALTTRMKDVSSEANIQMLRDRYGIEDTKHWELGEAQKKIKVAQVAEFIHPITYRPFDKRWIYYNPKIIEKGDSKYPTLRHMLSQNLGFLTARIQATGVFNAVFVSNVLVEMKTGESSRSSTIFPLFLTAETESKQMELGSSRQQPNFSPEFLQSLANKLGLRLQGEFGLPEGISPQDIFYYSYAVFHSPGYRDRYGEFLKNEFPRLPLPGRIEIFRVLAKLGGELVSLHLIESPKLNNIISNLVAPGELRVEKVSCSDGIVWLDKAKTRGFHGISEEVWNFHIGGYQICHKWLKDRGPKKGQPGRVLTEEDIDHYQKIIIAISETIRIMGEIDEVIEEHGGWPGAFVTE